MRGASKRLRGCGVQGIQALHRIEKQRTRKVSATAARLIVQVWSCQKLDQHADADNSRKLDAEGKAQIGRRLSASAQDGKAERTAASGRFGAAALSLRHAAALRHGSLCTAGAQGAALQVSRGVECSESLCRRCRKTVRPFLQPCPCLSGQINRSGFLHRATLLAFSPRTSEKSCPLCPRATRANCLVCSQRTSETFCPRFSWAGSEILPMIFETT